MVAGFSPAWKAARMALAFPAVTPGLAGLGAADVRTRRSRSFLGSLARGSDRSRAVLAGRGAQLHLPRLPEDAPTRRPATDEGNRPDRPGEVPAGLVKAQAQSSAWAA